MFKTCCSFVVYSCFCGREKRTQTLLQRVLWQVWGQDYFASRNSFHSVNGTESANGMVPVVPVVSVVPVVPVVPVVSLVSLVTAIMLVLYLSPDVQPTSPDIKWVDGHKPLFRVTTKLDSTIYTEVPGEHALIVTNAHTILSSSSTLPLPRPPLPPPSPPPFPSPFLPLPTSPPPGP